MVSTIFRNMSRIALFVAALLPVAALGQEIKL